MMSRIVSCFLMVFTLACSNDDIVTATAEADMIEDTATTRVEPPVNDTTPAPDRFTVSDTFQRVEVLTAGTFHDGEIEEGIETGPWFGLFEEHAVCFIEQVELGAERVHDPITDDSEEEKTGWQISQDGYAHPLLMMKGINFPESTVEHLVLPAEILPGDTSKFSFHNREYMVFATGNVIRDENTGEVWSFSNYRLFLSAEKNSKAITQQLVAYDFFDDAMVAVLFCGDLDGDGFPDFILDNVYKYNSFNPTLYLSSETGADELLHVVGWRKSVGC